MATSKSDKLLLEHLLTQIAVLMSQASSFVPKDDPSRQKLDECQKLCKDLITNTDATKD